MSWIAVMLASGIALGASTSPLAAQSPPAPLEMRSKGSPKAPVTVYEMSDFQCPYCRQFALETFPRLEQDYIRAG
jgi:protein-disulfide isomerase